MMQFFGLRKIDDAEARRQLKVLREIRQRMIEAGEYVDRFEEYRFSKRWTNGAKEIVRK
jgi:hypothetical protein